MTTRTARALTGLVDGLGPGRGAFDNQARVHCHDLVGQLNCETIHPTGCRTGTNFAGPIES